MPRRTWPTDGLYIFVNFLFCFCYFDLTWFISFDFHLFFDGGHEVV